MIKTIFGFLTEDNGKLSITRISIASVLGAYIVWTTIIIIKNPTLTSIPDMPVYLAGFLAALYNFNKGGSISIGKKNDTKG